MFGKTVLTTKFGFSSLMNFQNSLSPAVLEAAYTGNERSSSYGGGFQAISSASSFQVSTPTVISLPGTGNNTADDEDVNTNLFTEGDFAADRSMDLTPSTDGVITWDLVIPMQSF